MCYIQKGHGHGVQLIYSILSTFSTTNVAVSVNGIAGLMEVLFLHGLWMVDVRVQYVTVFRRTRFNRTVMKYS